MPPAGTPGLPGGTRTVILSAMKSTSYRTPARRRTVTVAAAACLVTAGMTAGTASAAGSAAGSAGPGLPDEQSVRAADSASGTSSVPSTGNETVDGLLALVVGSSEKTDYLGSLVSTAGSLATGSLGAFGSWEVLPSFFGSGS